MKSFVELQGLRLNATELYSNLENSRQVSIRNRQEIFGWYIDNDLKVRFEIYTRQDLEIEDFNKMIEIKKALAAYEAGTATYPMGD